VRQLNGGGPVFLRLLNSRFPFLFGKHMKLNGHTIIVFWNLKCLSVNAAVIRSLEEEDRHTARGAERHNILAGSAHRSGIRVLAEETPKSKS
jgi:hypothetical protein